MAKQRFDVGGISKLSLLDVVRLVSALRLVAMFLRLWHRAV